MNKPLTTSEMLDKLKIGEVAENYYNSDPQFKITRDSEGIRFKYRDEFIILYTDFLNCKWRILPKYVDFNVAKEAYAAGKTVRCDYISVINPNDKRSESYNINEAELQGAISWNLITYGKWSIEE